MSAEMLIVKGMGQDPSQFVTSPYFGTIWTMLESLFVAYPDQWYMDCVPNLSGCQTLVEAVHRNNLATARLKAEGYAGETYDQQLKKFYESVSNMWKAQYSDEILNSFPKNDSHSHARCP